MLLYVGTLFMLADWLVACNTRHLQENYAGHGGKSTDVKTNNNYPTDSEGTAMGYVAWSKHITIGMYVN